MTTSKYYMPSGRSIQAIDYNEKQDAGATIADSLQQQFTTRNGRPVSNGRGVEPDHPAPLETESELEKALVRRAAFFFYANHFAARNDSIPPGFTVSDDILSDFAAWLEEEQFTYRTDAETRAPDTGRSTDGERIRIGAGRNGGAPGGHVVRKQTAFERHSENLKNNFAKRSWPGISGNRRRLPPPSNMTPKFWPPYICSKTFPHTVRYWRPVKQHRAAPA